MVFGPPSLLKITRGAGGTQISSTLLRKEKLKFSVKKTTKMPESHKAEKRRVQKANREG